MQNDVKVYIVIENSQTKQEVNIKGSLELLGTFIRGISSVESIQADTSPTLPILNSPIMEPQP